MLGIVQRVDRGRIGGRDAALLRVRVPGETLNLLVLAVLGAAGAGPREAAVALLDAAEKVREARATLGGDARDASEAKWRAALEGSHVVRIEATRVVLAKGDALHTIEAGDRAGALALMTVTVTGTDGARMAPSEQAHTEPREALAARGDALARELASAAFVARRTSVVRALAKALARIERRVEAIGGDLARIATAEAKARAAQLFVAEAARAPRGARELAVVDWSSGEAKTVTMPLDPARGAREQLDALFKRARRLKEAWLKHRLVRNGPARIGKIPSKVSQMDLHFAARLPEPIMGDFVLIAR